MSNPVATTGSTRPTAPFRRPFARVVFTAGALAMAILWSGVGCNPGGDDGGNSAAGSDEQRPDARGDGPGTRSATATTSSAGAGTPAADDPGDPPERLLGAWVAEDVPVSMGEVKIKLVFREENGVQILAWSDLPFVGEVRDKTAPYEVHGNTISSEALRGGTSVQYRFAGDDLIIEYQDGKTVRFHPAGQ